MCGFFFALAVPLAHSSLQVFNALLFASENGAEKQAAFHKAQSLCSTLEVPLFFLFSCAQHEGLSILLYEQAVDDLVAEYMHELPAGISIRVKDIDDRQVICK